MGISLGLSETASTFFMDEGADSGDILSQKKSIDKHENASTLYAKITKTALNQIEDFIPKLISGDFQKTPQNHKKANLWRKRNINDGSDWRMQLNQFIIL